MFYCPVADGTARSEIACFVLSSKIKRRTSKISMCFQGKDLIVSYHQLLGIPGEVRLLCTSQSVQLSYHRSQDL